MSDRILGKMSEYMFWKATVGITQSKVNCMFLWNRALPAGSCAFCQRLQSCNALMAGILSLGRLQTSTSPVVTPSLLPGLTSPKAPVPATSTSLMRLRTIYLDNKKYSCTRTSSRIRSYTKYVTKVIILLDTWFQPQLLLLWGFPWPWGYPNSWMVCVRENPI